MSDKIKPGKCEHYSDDMCRLPDVTGRADDYIAEPITPEQSKQLIDKENQ